MAIWRSVWPASICLANSVIYTRNCKADFRKKWIITFLYHGFFISCRRWCRGIFRVLFCLFLFGGGGDRGEWFPSMIDFLFVIFFFLRLTCRRVFSDGGNRWWRDVFFLREKHSSSRSSTSIKWQQQHQLCLIILLQGTNKMRREL